MYSPSKADLKKNPSWVVGSGQRYATLDHNQTPGVGNYNLAYNSTEGPKVRKILSIEFLT